MSISKSKPNAGDITLLLSNTNDPESLRTVMRLAYKELHGIAVHHFREEPPGGTLQPTALIHEVFLRFFGGKAVFENRRHFFAAASRAMYRILVENARRRGAFKRGGHSIRVDFSEAERIGFEKSSELLDFHTALRRLEELKPLWAEIAELRVFGEWSNPEAAVILGIGKSTARRRWQKARAWLRDFIAQAPKYSTAGNQKLTRP